TPKPSGVAVGSASGASDGPPDAAVRAVVPRAGAGMPAGEAIMVRAFPDGHGRAATFARRSSLRRHDPGQVLRSELANSLSARPTGLPCTGTSLAAARAAGAPSGHGRAGEVRRDPR